MNNSRKGKGAGGAKLPEFIAFDEAMKKLAKVSKKELDRKIAEEQIKKRKTA